MDTEFVPAGLSPLQLIQTAQPAWYYQQYLQGPPLVYLPDLNCYVVARAALIAEVLTHPACRVRPCAQPIPIALHGRASGDFFAALMRMNDGERHLIAKQVSRQLLSQINPAQVNQACQRALQQLALDVLGKTSAEQLIAGTQLPSAAALNQWLSSYPLYVLANLLGFADAQQASLVSSVRQLMACLAPDCDSVALAGADVAINRLYQDLQLLWQAEPAAPLLQQLRQQVASANWQDLTAVLLNLAGWFSQSFDGCRGLLSSALLRLQAQSHWQARCVVEPAFCAAFLQEVCRLDAPIQNTRRFTSTALTLAGEHVAEQQTLLLLLAAANLDSSADAHNRLQFRPERPASPLWCFGHGAHQCPGQQLSLQLAAQALPYLIEAGAVTLAGRHRFLPSHNARIAEFMPAKELA